MSKTTLSPQVDLKVLYIDAWAEPEGGWNWNDHTCVDNISVHHSQLTTRKILKRLRQEGFLNDISKGRVMVDHHPEIMEGFLIEVLKRNSGRPFLALSNIH